jgi:lysophospholipase L1-like esterase
MKLFSKLPLVVASLVLTVSIFAQNSKYAVPKTDDGLPGAGPIRRADWFVKLWEDRRSAWAQRVQKDQGSLIFLGDSITQGWGDDMGGNFAGVKVANRGISGDTSRGVLIRLDEDVIALKPQGVVILIGTNDLYDKADPETVAANLKLIIAKLKAHNAKMPIVLCQIFPSSASKDRPAEQVKKLNQLYAAAVKGDAQIISVDTWGLFANAQGDAKAEEFPDLLHPNQTGYAKWAAALRPLFATLGFLENEDDNFALEQGFVSLFNGHDLTGWGFKKSTEGEIQSAQKAKENPNGPAWSINKSDVSFDGVAASQEGRYVAKHGRLIVTTPAEGRRIQTLWTTKEFSKDFVLKLEFRATPNADSGVFLRKPQLQCRDYLLAGPYKQLKQYKPQEWNEIVVTVKGDEAHATCNGELLEAAMKLPETGPIGLEGDRGQMEYRRIRIRELP